MSLSQLERGKQAVITGHNHPTPALVQRLMEMGLTVGTSVEVAHHAPFGGTIAVRCRGTLIALRITDAAKIEVKRTL